MRLPRKIYMMIQGYSGVEPCKRTETSLNKCGLDAYRLLVKKYDPVSLDTECHLQDRVIAIARWSINNSADGHDALRESTTGPVVHAPQAL